MRYFLDNMFWNESYYPTTIVIDRYNGCYSGGKWLAFPCFFYDVPEEIEGEDPECSFFWENCNEPVGKGNTPQEAFDNLKEIMKTK